MLLKKIEKCCRMLKNVTSDLAAKQEFVDLKTEVDKVDINKLNF